MVTKASTDGVPFVHRFKTTDHCYVYDVNTARIVRVSPPVWDLLEHWGTLPQPQILARHRGTYDAETLHRAVTELSAARTHKGLFLPKHPRVARLLSDAELQRRLDNSRAMLTLMVTKRCNMRCEYCSFADDIAEGRETPDMPWEIARLALHDFVAHSTESRPRYISFFGGEPLVNFRLIKRVVSYVDALRDADHVEYSITTNGLLLKGYRADFLAAHGFRVTVSLDGPRHIHDRYRLTPSGKGTWNTVVANVTSFLERHPEYQESADLSYNCVLAHPIHLAELQDFFANNELIHRNTKLNLVWEGLSPKRSENLSEEDMRLTGFHDVRGQFLRNLREGNVAADPRSPEFKVQRELFERPLLTLHKRRHPPPESPTLPDVVCPLTICVPGCRRCFVSTEGNYYPCERVTPNPWLQIGSVTNGIAFTSVRRLMDDWLESTKHDCASCWCVRTCSVGCFATLDETPLIVEAKKAACAEARQRQHAALVAYCSVLEQNPHALDYMAQIQVG